MAEDKLFFVGQKAFVKKDGEVLILISKDLGLDFPGGKIQEDEEFDEALLREVKEETGLEIKVGEPFMRWRRVLKYGEKAGKEVFLVGFKCDYISGEVKISDEHSKYLWMNKNSYKELDDGSDTFKALEKYFNSI